MKRTLISLALMTTMGIVGCSSNTQNENTGVGALTGAAVGGLGAAAFHGNPVAIGAGIVGGALIGGFIGHKMDSSDTTTSNSAIQSNPTKQTTRWVNAKTGVAYSMTPTSELFTVNGNPNCRNFYFTSTQSGKTNDYNGTACLMKDGSWHTVRR